MAKKNILLLLSLWAAIAYAVPVKTTLSVQVYNYKGDHIYFDCTQSPLYFKEFPVKPEATYTYQFETDKVMNMMVNGTTEILLLPGDSLKTEIYYGEKTAEKITFSGSVSAVLQNQLYWNVELTKRDMRYKNQLLSCVVLDVKPKDRIADSHKLMEKVKAMIDIAGKDLPTAAANYILSTVDSYLYNSMMEYPMMYADTRKVAVDKQEIGDYWHIMDGFTTRDDDASLNNPMYASMLMRYCFYEKERKAKESNTTFTRPDRMETMYNLLATFYTGKQRDYVLFCLMCNFIRAGKELQRLDPLLEIYKEKYCIDKDHLKLMETLLQ